MFPSKLRSSSAADVRSSPLKMFSMRSRSRASMLTEPLWPASGPPSAHLAYNLQPIQATEALSPIDLPTMNSLNGRSDSPQRARTPNSIRAVPAESLQIETSSSTSNDDSRRNQSRNDATGLSSSKSYGSTSTGPPLSWQNNQSNLPVSNGLVRSISSEFGPMKGFSNGNTSGAVEDANGAGVSPSNGNTQTWSAAIGKAGQGKSGRVIDRLMGENDALKRDIKLERLRNEESKLALKMIESRMEAMSAGLEREIKEASFNGLQLKRRDRQLVEAKAEVEYERRRVADVEEKMKQLMDETAMIQENAAREIAKAKERAMHFEASYTTMSCHWPGERAKFDKEISVMDKQIKSVVSARNKDDEQISMLRSLGEQQAAHILQLQKQNESIRKAHEQYKEEQERALHDIKTNAKNLEERHVREIEKGQQLSQELKWALGLHKSRTES